MALLTATTLKNVAKGGLIAEDVMNKIWDISNIPLPFQDLVGTGEAAKSSYKEWTTDTLSAPNLNNAVTDGYDATGNDTVLGARVGNHCQTSVKNIQVSTRADTVKKFGRASELAYQLERRQIDLRRDQEGILLANQASVADTGPGGVAGKLGTLASWIVTNHFSAGATPGTAGGFNTSTGLTVARTPGIRGALSETMLRNAIQSIYEQGGDVRTLMSVPSVISRISEYLFSSTAKVAQVRNNITDASEAATVLAAVNVYVSDFGTITMVPNRMQQTHLDTTAVTPLSCADVFLLDPKYITLSYLRGHQVESMAKTGLSEKRLMSVDWTFMCFNEKSQGIIGDVNPAAAMIA
jgi:hypothetical protein